MAESGYNAPAVPDPRMAALLAHLLLAFGLLLGAAHGGQALAAVRKPPMGWSSWNYRSMRVSAPLLLDTADAFVSTGLRDAGYVYLIATEGWEPGTRTASGDLQPAPSFTNSTVRALADELHAKGYKFGIYGAAGFTTCGHRAGSLYHERQDARWYKEQGVDYLKYDDCGEANIQSYAKYSVMKDALAAQPGGGLDYYSYEPFQVYGVGAVQQVYKFFFKEIIPHPILITPRLTLASPCADGLGRGGW